MGKHNTSMEPRRYRSGEAARLARMPAATLRIWERRYAVVSPQRPLQVNVSTQTTTCSGCG